MTDMYGWSRSQEQEWYTLPAHDPLGVLTSTQLVVEQGEQVWINPEQIELLSEQWAQMGAQHTRTTAWYPRYHFFDGSERTVNLILLLDALNFCFWGEKDQPRWTVAYQGDIINGYMAEAAALTRAIAEGLPLWDATFLSDISEDTMATILRGTDASVPIPLFEQRVHNAREVGRVLLTHYDGQFSHAIEQAQYDAVQLASLLARDFPSFHDVTRYRQYDIRFLKRAQICVADLHNAFGNTQWGKFSNFEYLTCFADYKLPQVLRHYNVIEYTPALAEMVDTQEQLEAGSEAEIEIRAATVWACELLQRILLQRGITTTAADIDQLLWLMGQEAEQMRPYHRTRTIYY